MIQNDDTKIFLKNLFDEKSFIELNSSANSAAKAGYGAVNGNLIFAYSLTDKLSSINIKKIKNICKKALESGAPLIGVFDASAADIQENTTLFEYYGMLFEILSKAKNKIPILTIILGETSGILSVVASFSDFIFMVDGSKFSFSTKNLLENKKTISLDTVFDLNFHEKYTNVISEFYDNIFDTAVAVRRLLSFLPSNNLDELPNNIEFLNENDLNFEDENLNSLINSSFSKEIIEDIILKIADTFEGKPNAFELKKYYSKNLTTMFAFIGGYPSGVLGVSGKLSKDELLKANDFIKFCNSFNISIVTFSNILGFEGDVLDDFEIMKNISLLIETLTKSSIGRINIILKNSYGFGYFIMNSFYLSADITYAWEGSKIGLIPSEVAKNIFDLDLDTNAIKECELASADNIIKPSETRKRIISALDMTANKRIF